MKILHAFIRGNDKGGVDVSILLEDQNGYSVAEAETTWWNHKKGPEYLKKYINDYEIKNGEIGDKEILNKIKSIVLKHEI